jgi:hypothetical protein
MKRIGKSTIKCLKAVVEANDSLYFIVNDNEKIVVNKCVVSIAANSFRMDVVQEMKSDSYNLLDAIRTIVR